MRTLVLILVFAAMGGAASAQNMPYQPTDMSKLPGARTPVMGVCGPFQEVAMMCCQSEGDKLIYCPNGFSCNADGRCLRKRG
jgi:hypothetical protein